MTTRYRQRGEFEAWRVGDDDKPEWILLTSQVAAASSLTRAIWYLQYRSRNNEHRLCTAYAGDWAVRDETGFVSVWDAKQFAARFEPATDRERP